MIRVREKKCHFHKSFQAAKEQKSEDTSTGTENLSSEHSYFSWIIDYELIYFTDQDDTTKIFFPRFSFSNIVAYVFLSIPIFSDFKK